MKKLCLFGILVLLSLFLTACETAPQGVPTPVATDTAPALATARPTASLAPSPAAIDTATLPSDTATPLSTEATATEEPTVAPEPTETAVIDTPTAEKTATPEPPQATDTVVESTEVPPTAVIVGPSTPTAEASIAAVKTPTTIQIVGGVGIDYPLAGSQVTLPIHVQARTGSGQTQVVLKLKWASGQELSNDATVLKDKLGNGWVVDDLDWEGEGAPPEWKTQPATLQVLTTGGKVLASRQLSYLAMDDPGTQLVKVYWTDPSDSSQVHELSRPIVKTKQLGAAAVSELLWGVGKRNGAGFTSEIPSPEEVIRFCGSQPGCGPRVTLRKLTIVNGTATADFSGEMMAYGGGSARVAGITHQIVATLKQFASVNNVVILVNGKPDALQP